MSPSALQVELCLIRLLREVRSGRISGINYSVQTADGLEVGWSGEHSGRRLVVLDDHRRILALDDPHAASAKRFGTER